MWSRQPPSLQSPASSSAQSPSREPTEPRGGLWTAWRVSDASVRDATRTLAVMLKARLPLVEALRTTREQCDGRRLSTVLGEVVREVEGGQTLAASLERHDDVFDDLYVHMVRVGERAGILEDVLDQLATYLEQRSALRRRVRLALVYPGLILTVALGATVFLLTVIVPTFADVFASFDATLPTATRLVLGVSDALRTHSLLIGGGLVGGVFGVRAVLATDLGRRVRDTVAIGAPLFGTLVTRSITARFCRTLGTLLRNGVGLVSALDIQRRAATNVHVQAALDAMVDGVRRGDGLTSTVAQSGVFPAMVVKMIQAGEKTAELDTMLLRAAEHYEDSVEAVTDTLASVLEPVVIVFIGALIGSILVAIYLPMFNMIDVVR